MQNSEAHMEIKQLGNDQLQIEFQGRLDLQTVADLWQPCMDLQQQHQPRLLIIEAQKLSYCDGAGIGLLLELRQRQHCRGVEFRINNLRSDFQELLAVVNDRPCAPKPEAHHLLPSMPVSVGQFTVQVINNIRDNIIFIGMLIYQLWQTLLHPSTMRWQDFWRAVEDVGPNGLAIVSLIGFLVGLISAFQSAIPMGRFGAQVYIINLVGLGLFREMGPLMTAVLLAGRTASSFAAELGTMTINQEVDALTTMGLDPIRFLTVPRVLAAMLMTPLLSLFLMFFGIVGCAIVMNGLGYNFDMFAHHLYGAVTLSDFTSGIVKTFAFGIVIAAIGCLHGLKTRMGASAVGYSTTQAVVSSLIMIVIVDGIFACVYYALGI